MRLSDFTPGGLREDSGFGGLEQKTSEEMRHTYELRRDKGGWVDLRD